MAELRGQQKLLDQEVRDLQQIVDRKKAEIQSISSVILQVSLTLSLLPSSKLISCYALGTSAKRSETTRAGVAGQDADQG